MSPPRDDKYVVLAAIASGGMGNVELAMRVQGPFRRLVAVKRLLTPLASDSDARNMFLDEAKLAGLLRHPNVVAVSDFGEDEGGPFLVMEFVEGASLSALLQRLRRRGELLPVATALEIARGAARGLEAAHSLRDHNGRWLELVHRDVSPPNILLSYEGAVQVTDFGVAKAAERVTRTSTGVLKGKLSYMAPELLRFEEATAQSDLFSLGIVLYETLTLERPFMGEDPRSIAREILNGRFKPVARDVPTAVSNVIKQLLEPDPLRRPSSAGEVAALLDAFLASVDESETVAAVLGTTFAAEREALHENVKTWTSEAFVAATTTPTAPTPLAAPAQPTSQPRLEAPTVVERSRANRKPIASVSRVALLTAAVLVGTWAAFIWLSPALRGPGEPPSPEHVLTTPDDPTPIAAPDPPAAIPVAVPVVTEPVVTNPVESEPIAESATPDPTARPRATSSRRNPRGARPSTAPAVDVPRWTYEEANE